MGLLLLPYSVVAGIPLTVPDTNCTLSFLEQEIQKQQKIAKGSDHQLNTDCLTQLVEQYQHHARFEEREFLPLAHRILSRNPNHMQALDLSLHMMHRPSYLAAHI